MKLNEVLVYVRSFRVFDIQVAIAVFTYPAVFLISSSGAYTWEGGGGAGRLISGSLCYDPFVEKLVKGLVRLLRPILFN